MEEASATEGLGDLDDRCLKCVIKKAILIRVGSPSVDFKSGCSVIDVTFPTTQPVEIGCISFLNNYTATLSLKFKTSDDTWKICLKNFELMASPHSEEGSQDKFIIKNNQMLHPIKDAVFIRIILRQPSPHWLNFSIENLSFLSPSKISSNLSDILASNIKLNDNDEPENDKVVSIANTLQQMWALTEIVSDNETTSEESPHFDVDGCYDLNLLSYT